MAPKARFLLGKKSFLFFVLKFCFLVTRDVYLNNTGKLVQKHLPRLTLGPQVPPSTVNLHPFFFEIWVLGAPSAGSSPLQAP